ncbi:MucR family transcriptional regulator [Tabrizicola sp. M-4]|uniref:MucR family transcriptional regulator n=1 Tax=Tabrizicola sp. M-4 TaxID=3055847 RepID=UPI003DA9A49B
MKADTQFLKTTVNYIVDQQMSRRSLSIYAVTDLAVDIVVSLLAATSDEEPINPGPSRTRRDINRKQAQFFPAVPIEDSVQDDYLICLEDGLRFKMLKRHLKEAYGMSPDEYRNKWGLPSDYPMAAPSYSRAKGEIARKLKLGRYPRR